MRYWIILLTATSVMTAFTGNGCNSSKKGNVALAKSDTTRWLGTYVNDSGKIFYDVVFLERKVNAKLDSTGRAYSELDSTFYVPIKKDSATIYVSAPAGSVRILENFDTSIRRLSEWFKK